MPDLLSLTCKLVGLVQRFIRPGFGLVSAQKTEWVAVMWIWILEGKSLSHGCGTRPEPDWRVCLVGWQEVWTRSHGDNLSEAVTNTSHSLSSQISKSTLLYYCSFSNSNLMKKISPNATNQVQFITLSWSLSGSVSRLSYGTLIDSEYSDCSR